MSRRELHCAVARATGESIKTVKRIGFLLADPTIPIPDPDDPRLGGHVIDWDALQADPIWKENCLV